jgi:FKBP-type peptidyl-prolyl cis-trans isomerase
MKVLGSTAIPGSLLTAFYIPLEAIAQDNTSTGNGADEQYIITPKGIKYKVIKPPNDTTSPTPKRAQKVKAKYTLYLNGFPEDTSNSVKIDSTKGILGGERPFEFLAGVSQVIKGWDLAIMDMRVGEARKLVIPSDLGYGDKGAGRAIPGGSTLYFDLELVGMGEMAKMGEEQYRWLEEHPL